jgi:metal-dependent amidase/aminoacylase/carboxypeptidase family protein
MVEDGLMERFAITEVYGLHNMPGVPVGQLRHSGGGASGIGGRVSITVTGGGHAAVPHQAVDTTLVASHVVIALQSIVARNADPLASIVVTVGVFRTDSTASNVIPHKAVLEGTVRTLDPALRDLAEARIKAIATATAQAYGASAEVVFERGYPVTVNHPEQTRFAADCAAEVVGERNVDRTPARSCRPRISLSCWKRGPGPISSWAMATRRCATTPPMISTTRRSRLGAAGSSPSPSGGCRWTDRIARSAARPPERTQRMPVKNRFAELLPEITAWRRDFHEHPELLFDVHRTAGIVAEKLREFGCDEVVDGHRPHRRGGGDQGAQRCSGKVIGLRADMDALPIFEATGLPPMPARHPARCMPAAMTATPPCFWARRNIWPRRAISTAPAW